MDRHSPVIKTATCVACGGRAKRVRLGKPATPHWRCKTCGRSAPIEEPKPEPLLVAPVEAPKIVSPHEASRGAAPGGLFLPKWLAIERAQERQKEEQK